MNVTKARNLVTACLALCVIVWLASTARAQTLSSDYTTSATKGEAPSPPEAAKLPAIPQLLAGSANYLGFETCSVFSILQPRSPNLNAVRYQNPNNAQVREGVGDIRPILPLNLYSALRGTSLETSAPGLLHEAQGREFSLLTNSASVQPGSLLYPLETQYLLWESRLADDVPLTNQKELLVYPLLQIRVANVVLPISPYVPPLRGSDPR
jgi:hypothetical protein